MKLTVEERTIYGKQTKQLRNQWYVPCSIYGKHVDTTMHVMVKKNEFIKLYRQTGSSQVIDLVGAAKEMVLVHEYQKNPVTDDVIHIDFLAVNANELVTTDVVVKWIGEAPLEKNNIGKISLIKDYISVQALPKDLPHHIELDVSGIETLEDGIFIRDIDLGSKVTILDDPDLAIIAAVAIKDEVEEETVVEPLNADANTSDADENAEKTDE